MWGPGVFSLGTPKYFLPKMERKLSGDEFFLIDKNVHVYVHNFFKLPLFLFTKKKSCLYFFCLLPWAVTLLCFSLATLPLFLFLFFIFLFFFFWLSPGRPFFFFFSWQYCPFFLGSNVASSFFLFSFSIFFFFFFLGPGVIVFFFFFF